MERRDDDLDAVLGQVADVAQEVLLPGESDGGRGLCACWQRGDRVDQLVHAPRRQGDRSGLLQEPFARHLPGHGDIVVQLSARRRARLYPHGYDEGVLGEARPTAYDSGLDARAFGPARLSRWRARGRRRPRGRRRGLGRVAVPEQLERLGQHPGPEPVLDADRDHAGQRLAARPRVHGRLPHGRQRDQARRAVVPARDRRPALRHDRRRQHLRRRRRHRQDHLALEAGQRGRVPELRHRRQPRRRLLRRQALHHHAGHAHRLGRSARPGSRSSACRSPRRCPARPRTTATRRRARRICANGQRRDRRRRLGVRRARLRDGLQARTSRPPGRTRSGRSRPRGRAGASSRASSAAASSGRRRRSTRPRTRCTSAPAPRRRSTSRSSGPARTRAPTR